MIWLAYLVLAAVLLAVVALLGLSLATFVIGAVLVIVAVTAYDYIASHEKD
jgi:hypothetical protein